MGLALALICAKAASPDRFLLTVAQAAKRRSPGDGRGCAGTTEVMCAPIAH